MIKDIIKYFYDTCFNCKRQRFGVRHREVPMPNSSLVAKSREKICTDCYRTVLKEVNKGQKYD